MSRTDSVNQFAIGVVGILTIGKVSTLSLDVDQTLIALGPHEKGYTGHRR